MRKIFPFCFLLCNASAIFAQLPNTDIWMLDIKADKDSITFTNPVNITNRTGYDNQPAFSPDGKYILYTSIRDEKQSDIFKYDLKTKTTSQFTNTITSEYSPTFMPDGKNISVVMVEADSAQRLWKFPIKGGKPSLIMDKVDSIGYHAWYNKGTLGVFILTEPPTLQIVQLWNQVPHIVADSIGRCFQMDGNTILYYTQKTKDGKIELCQFILPGMATKQLGIIMESEDYCFIDENVIYGMGPKLFLTGFSLKKKEILDLSKIGIKNITRLSISKDGTRLAIVAE